ncbi:hypothetical protein [uncultured Paludibaculum sp.]|uniref:hypothetical protein n=1 Tax=uncultured Paludibaculum sp. TaxID=1765020 RepID=UPI002AAB0498|nr:hypothetical protein [uncultured Paludibaculum sp.]
MIFEVRVVNVEDGRVEQGSFDTVPTLEQAEKVVRLMREFLSTMPAQFRAAVPFLKRGSIELEWASATGGVAFATFHESGQAATLAVMASDPFNEAGQGVLAGLQQSLNFDPEVVAPVEGPLMVVAALPGAAEWQPILHLLNTSLAAVYFGAILKQ